MNTTATPEILWAQRSSTTEAAKNIIYLTISVPDVAREDLVLDLKPQSISFSGTSSSLKRQYEVTLDLFDEIDVDETKIHHTAKNLQLVLRKKQLKEEYWPRLIKDNKKLHYLKTDFEKWVDEDEQDGIPEDDLGNMGGMGGMGGMPGMGDMGSMLGGGGLDFSNLGGDMGGDDADDADDAEDDDEEMPALEGEEEKTETSASKSTESAEPSSKAKIEEVP
ncbi:Protein wos2 [Erysiphe neolycopersici]|uniref:Protein wos2 n=1 Tax=Erysiphe neolycopersici TaxID=212602 RepID=A0A420HF25_9PEZI|nr:Protein wos2 [Erysiphe neolycopersici]